MVVQNCDYWRGREQSPIRIEKMRNVRRTDEIKKKISDKLTGVLKSEETKKKMSENSSFRNNVIRELNSIRMKEKIKCPHCEKIGGRGAMQRHHFNNCKLKQS